LSSITLSRSSPLRMRSRMHPRYCKNKFYWSRVMKISSPILNRQLKIPPLYIADVLNVKIYEHLCCCFIFASLNFPGRGENFSCPARNTMDGLTFGRSADFYRPIMRGNFESADQSNRMQNPRSNFLNGQLKFSVYANLFMNWQVIQY
jgi:hypothetical protein